MVKLCIIETENHHEVIRSVVDSLKGFSYDITIITHAKCIPFIYNLKDSQILNFSVTDFNANDHFSKYKYDRILFITPPHFHDQRFKFLYGKSYLLIHNIHFWTTPFKNMSFWLEPKNKPLVHFLKLLKYLPSTLVKRKSFLRSFEKVFAPSSALYKQNSDYLDGYLDLRFPSYLATAKKKETIQIVLPGTINENRRYNNLISMLDAVSSKFDQKIILELLGRGKVSSIKTVDSLKIREYPNGISAPMFDKIMSEATFGILHVKSHKSYKGILELKGKSNLSGAINDFYRFGIPALIPDFYPINSELGLLHQYSEKNLGKLLLEWISDKTYQKYADAFRVNSPELSQKISQHNREVLLD